jgi:hypothetical protein
VLERSVPALPSLQGISDHNTLEAFRHVYDLLNVRNGDVGDGRDAFVTRKELADNGGIVVGGFGGRASLANGLQAGTVSNWAAVQTRTLSDLENAVRASPFFNYLQTPIKRLAQEGAQIRTEQTTLQTSFASLARINSVMQAQISASYVLLEENRQVSADLDGRLSAQWSVKIDINGYVSGFGLSSTANNSTPFSEFYIAADRFAIGSPGVPRGTTGGQFNSPTSANVPFIVQTTTTTLNGKTVLPGVYVRDLFVQNGSIVRARIGTAAVDSLEIEGNAATIPVSAAQSGGLSFASGSTAAVSVASAGITLSSGRVLPNQIHVIGNFAFFGAGAGAWNLNVSIKVTRPDASTSNITVILNKSLANNQNDAVCAAFVDAPVPGLFGTYTYEIIGTPSVAPGATMTIVGGYILLLGTRR